MALGRQSVYYLVGRVATGVIGLLTLTIFTRVLSPSEYGRYSVAVALAALLSGLLFQWLRQGLVRFGTHDRETWPQLYATIGATFTVLIVASLVIVAGGGRMVFPRVPLAEMVAICGVAWAQSWFELSMDAARMDFRPIRYGVAAVMRATLCMTLGAIGALWIGGWLPLLVGVTMGYFFSGFVPAPGVLSSLGQFRKASGYQLRRLLSYGLPLSLTLGMTFIVDSSDRLMLAVMRTDSEVGVYAAAYNLSQFSIGTLMAGISLAAYPLAVRSLRTDGESTAAGVLARNILLLVGVGGPAAVGLALLARPIGSVLLGNFDASSTAIVTQVVALGAFLAALRAYGFDLVLLLKRRTGVQSLVMLLAVVINIGLNLILIPRAGAVGAAWSTLAAFAAAFVASLVLGRRLLRVRLHSPDLAKILIAGTAMVIHLLAWPAASSVLSLFRAIVISALIYIMILVLLDAANMRHIAHAAFRRLCMALG